MICMTTPAIFLDKDGTLLENVPYCVDVGQMRLTRNAGDALRLWHAAGYLLVVVSNQSGVARGYFDEAEIGPVTERLHEIFDAEQVPLAGFYYCPHHPEGHVARYAHPCGCRKPQPGMLLRAACELQLNLERSWMIGDILDDVEAGVRAGCGTVLIDNGGETIWQVNNLRIPDFLASDLYEAAQYVLFSSPAHAPLARYPREALA